MPFADTSNIVDGQPIDAADVKVPIDALDTALTTVLAGTTHKFTAALFAQQSSIGTVVSTDGALYLQEYGLYLKRASGFDHLVLTTNDLPTYLAAPTQIGSATPNLGAFTALSASSFVVSSTAQFLGQTNTNYLFVQPTGSGAFPDGVAFRVNDSAGARLVEVSTSTNMLAVTHAGLVILRLNGTGNSTNAIQTLQSNGTITTPTATLNSDILGQWQSYGNNGTTTALGANIVVRATQNFATGAHGSRVEFFVVANGATSLTQALTINATNVLVGTSCEIDGALDHDGTTVGFYNTTPIAKPTASGSRAGNAALESLLTALANLGLITNSTTA